MSNAPVRVAAPCRRPDAATACSSASPAEPPRPRHAGSASSSSRSRRPSAPSEGVAMELDDCAFRCSAAS